MKLCSKKIFLLISLAVISICTTAQSSLSRVNFAYQFDPKAEIFVNSKAYTVSLDSVALTISIFLNEESIDLKNYKFQLKTSLGYTNPLEPVPFDSVYIGKRGNSYFLKFLTQKWPSNRVLVLEIESRFSSAKYYYDIQPVEVLPIDISDAGKVSITQSWVRPGEFNTNKSATGLFYDYYFEPALPPMVTRAPDPRKEMLVNSNITLTQSAPFNLSDEGLYLFQEDSLAQSAAPVLLVDRYFPKPAKLRQLIDPLIYITQKEEWESLDKDSVSKRDFDQFWLDITRSTDRARKVIKTYYDRIEEANQFFTTYKAGWKTDKGMIYAIFGAPDRVIKGADKETWYYNATSISQSIDFDFIRVNSIFSNNHYVLIRDRRYSNSWYQAINNLRKVRY
ncbi:MAG: GWxTD domain-containing protein [Bacteroidota bacterium]